MSYEEIKEKGRNHIAVGEYRSEIDGLRAIAVLSVVGFHLFPNYIRGGYVGVDIFFVISGFLITNIICSQMKAGGFSFYSFYSKRIKRIFPALITVIVATMIFGFFSLIDVEYKLLGKHVFGGSIFVSNLMYWQESGYFDTEANSKPLLHLWSLAVEEQFYIFWPLCLWATFKAKKNPLYITLVIILASFVFEMTQMRSDAVGAFYSPLTRFWELSVGSVLAYSFIYKKTDFENLRIQHSTSLSVVGLSLILYSIFLFSKETPFPSWRALLPVLGAALLILTDSSSHVSKNVLSSRLLVFIGLISYPLYLWHWPLFFYKNLAGYQIYDSGNGERVTKILIVLVAIGLSYVTYKFIEKPIRFRLKNNIVPFLLLVSLLSTGGIGLGIYVNDGDGLPGLDREERFPRSLQKVIESTQFTVYPIPTREYVDNQYGSGFKAIGTASENKIIIFGDSHAEQYWNTIDEITKNRKSDSYKVLINSEPEIISSISDQIINDKTISKIVFSYYWAFNYGNPNVNQKVRCCGSGNGGVVGITTRPALSENQQVIIDNNLISIVEKLKAKGKDVIFILDNPFGEELDAHASIDRKLFSIGYKPTSPLLRRVAIERSQPTRNRIINVAKRSGASYIDPYDYLCEKDVCPAVDKTGERLYKDYDHISTYASKNTVKYLNEIFE